MLIPSPIQKIEEPLFDQKGIKLWLKREDLIHPSFGGNKYRKLMPNLEQAKRRGCGTLVTFGGRYSNHIAATASLGRYFGFKTIGLIRAKGEDMQDCATVQMAKIEGMEVHSLSYTDYRLRHNAGYLAELQQRFGENAYIIPEGGTNQCAIEGCKQIAVEATDQLDEVIDFWCVPVGTGGTVSGLLRERCNHLDHVLGFAALPPEWMSPDVRSEFSEHGNSGDLILGYQFGGFAKISDELVAFVKEFYHRHCILLDLIYTGKMLFGIYDMIRNGVIPFGSNIMAIHTGGQQGLLGFQEKQNIRIVDQAACY